MKLEMIKNKSIIILLLILTCAIYLRFYNLGGASFWVDELNHVFAGMSLSKGETPVFPSGVPNERALLYSRIVGLGFTIFGTNEFAARFGSAVFGVLAIILIYRVGKRLLNERVGLVAAFLLTFSHSAIGWSRTCRMYTLFQFLFLLGVFVFYRGFEATNPKAQDRKSFVGRIRLFFVVRNVKLSLLLTSAVIFFISLKIHQLTGLFVMTVLVYFLIGSIAELVSGNWKAALASKYFMGLAAIAAALFAGFTFFNLGEFIQYALDFHPTWARYSKAEDSYYYFWYLTSGENFPIAVFFLIGGLQALVRLNRPAIFMLIAFIVPFYFHSFVFSYKASNYVFNVLPFYLLIAAYGAVNLYEAEILNLDSIKSRLGRLGEKVSLPAIKRFATIALIIWIPMTVWFRIAVKLPLIGSSGYNGVITHYDWRGACEFLKKNSSPDDLIITTLPLTVLYYLNRVDFNLNLAHLDESLKWTTPSANGRHHEFYTGVPSVESRELMEELMFTNKKGWIIADVYRLEKEQYVSKALSEFIKSNLTAAWSDKNNTMVIYSWSQ